ncbi:DUF3466 family protein [Pseudoalteromonas sp. SG45-5]|uniref:DUF3466 family protein n=1 Tax=unclassified Pseudoalteromonas TaxID=194690 RepID=UPI0015F93AE7|nr:MULTISPECIES: DUF3466 family protein [unclassified Pseudoalteromonas]MBB1386290.1 DUF3466 family protein [Pseudoalteromonas sp. SG45-5]MBB1394339.1 DUF3466 family protein [Pseudoalteromonas sp. SG44-4]MBB1447667.1 DUF3466 family protein [Pseudoalteromonas sp. SG41-6]
MKYKLLAASVLATLSTSAMSATYQLSELGTLEGAKHSYISDVSESGHVIGFANGVYNLPIDISYIDFTESVIKTAYNDEKDAFELSDKVITFTLDDIENKDAINTNPDAHSFMVGFLSRLSSNFEYQKLNSLVAVDFKDGSVIEQPLFDIASVDYDGLTRSTTNIYNAVSEDGVAVGWGSAPYDKVSFTPDGEDEAESWFTHEFIERGIVVSADGVRVPLTPEFNEYGGTSRASDIVKTANGYTVVGSVSTSIPDDRQVNINDSCDNEDEPTSVCINLLNTNIARGLFNKRAVKWELDNSLNITSVEQLGLALTPDEGETEDDAFTSTAIAINANGTIVGSSNTRYDNNNDIIITMPVYFKGGEVVSFLDQENDSRQSGKAVAVNDNEIITGYATKVIENTRRNKFFYHDIKTGNTVFPTSYFNSSSSFGNDINNKGYIVGEGEVGTTDSSRRKEAFVYKIGDDKITNLNDLLPCFEADGETTFAYTMAEAKVINENNEIFGVATKTVEKRNSLGGVVTDINGKTEFESVAVAVKLTPLVNGTVENCAPPEAEVYERNSASFPWYALLLLPLVGVRRFFRF